MNQDFMNVNSWKEEDKNEDVEIDLVEIWQVIKKQFGLLVIIVILCAVLAGVISKFFIAPKYTSSSTIFLTPSISETGVVDYTSQNSNEKLVNNVMALLVQDNILSEVAKQTGMESVEDLRNQIKVSNDTNTTLVKVEATTLDPKLSKNIVNSTVNVFIDTMQENLNLKNIEIVDKAKLSYEPSGPNVKKNILMGAAAGFVIDALIVVLKVLTNTKLKSKEEAEKYLKLPVFCELPVIKD
ncbi:MAG: Wzz/FepE/Etk N-terminal domain-containing protein [Floccifex porci]|uniref:YveK family protein n=1 Tax=Floccifex porci TaxID=2606629 RepID=UPI002A81956C|nr:Wzz/FepE/Etk N-terminal domain-containing protein [Floccifex porci]MDY4796293.1 Wzz/FepE/Etk N-terminal domain-containing protein [Floccifex porci]